MNKSSGKPEVRGLQGYMRVIGVSCLAGAAIILVFLLIFAVIMSSVDVPQALITPFSIAAMAAGSIAAGYFCGRIVKSRGLIFGLVCGTVIFLLMLICRLTLIGGGFSVLVLYKYIICAAGAMIGCVCGVNKRKKLR